MKLSFSTLSCPDWNLRQIIDAATANGIGGVDLRGLGEAIDITKSPPFTAELASTSEMLRSANLAVPCLHTSITLVAPAPERWQMMLEECQRHAQLAQQLGTRYIRVFGGVVPKEMTLDEARMQAQRHLRQLVKICRPLNCQPLVETHDDWSISERILELLHEIDPADAAVLWDMENSFRHGEPPLETATRLRRYIRHVHIRDSVRVDGKPQLRLLGQGELPLADMLSALKRIEYTGWITLETMKRWIPQDAPEPEDIIPQFASFMRENW